MSFNKINYSLSQRVSDLLTREDREIFLYSGIPAMSASCVFSALPKLQLDPASELLRFSQANHDDGIFLKLSNGKVVIAGPTPNTYEVINSSLPQYVACASLFLQGAPYDVDYDDDDSIEKIEQTASALFERMHRIDAEAVTTTSFWGGKCDDITIGDWSAD